MLNKSGVTMMDLLKDPFLRQLTLIAVVVMASQQLAGINAVRESFLAEADGRNVNQRSCGASFVWLL